MKTYLLRIGFVIPIVLFAVYLLLVTIGCLVNAAGADSSTFCALFSQGAAVLFTLAVAATLYCQGRACFPKN